MPKKQGVIIESRRTGERYGVTVADFEKHYHEQGFKIVSNEDGSKYRAPKKADEANDADTKAAADTAAKTDKGAGE